MDRVVPISEARATLGDLIAETSEHEVYLLKHGRPVGVLVSVDAYERIVARIEDLEDENATLHARAENDFEPFVPSTPAAVR